MMPPGFPPNPMAVPQRKTSYDESITDDSGSATTGFMIEADSDCGSSFQSSTKSARESIFQFVRENGRTYHSYQAGKYLLPNDQSEIDRLDLQYEILRSLMGNKLYKAPIDNPYKILDIGTGTGKWPIEMANLFEYAEITGTDLSPIQPDSIPPNVKFVIDDANEEDWLINENSYDFIHTQMLLGSFDDFREIIRKAYRYVKPGGWMESVELYPTIYCDDGTMPADWPVAQWSRLQDQAAMRMGKPIRIGNKLKRWYEQNGFVDVHEEVYKVPMSPWPRDPKWKMLGKFHQESMLQGCGGISMAFFHRGLGWTQEEIEVYLVPVRKAFLNRQVHAYQKIYVVWGRKPEDAVNPPPRTTDPDNTPT